jgi:glycosyltransferase involved in cell wall biosynthesis
MQDADLFCLPSLSDPSPLSLVEAAFSELPLLVSEYCGNHPELVLPRINGMVFNPYDAHSVHSSFEWVLANRSSLRSIGSKSRQIAMASYTPSVATATLLNDMKRNSLLGLSSEFS